MNSTKGDAFEREVLDLLSRIPGVEVEEHRRLSGKDVDLFCLVREPIGGTIRVAVECKDYAKRLNRAEASAILSDYLPLLQNGDVDRICLITRNGLHANAKSCFNGKTTQHLMLSDLIDQLIGPRQLVENMKIRFSEDDLNKFYIETRYSSLDLEWTSKNFTLVYNPFIDFSVEIGVRSLATASMYWQDRQEDLKAREDDAGFKGLPLRYSDELFADAVANRIGGRPAKLLPVVLRWVNDDAVSQGLAILGTYGTGKSCFSKKLAHELALRYVAGDSSRIPLLIELKDFGAHQDIRGLITHELTNRHGLRLGSYDVFQYLNRAGKFVLVLDGFDEMKQGMTKDAVIFTFNELNKLHGGRSKVVLCGRPTVFADEGEQTAILAGSNDSVFTSVAEYIQLRLVPFSTAEIITFLRLFAKAKYPKSEVSSVRLLDDLAEELRSNPDLQDLLSRPVHLPMLAAVLPDWNGPISELRRGRLYERFIEKTIAREMLKSASFHLEYDMETRRRFASTLATEMLKRGESRTIRYSEITDEMLKPFQKPGYSLDGVRRDLVRACFLDRRAPDILYFSHKSYAEFLAADQLVHEMSRDLPNTTKLGVSWNSEIISFVCELASETQWKNAFHAFSDNIPLLRAVLQSLEREELAAEVGERLRGNGRIPPHVHNAEIALTASSVLNSLRDGITSRGSSMVLFHYVTFLESIAVRTHTLSFEVGDFLRTCLEQAEDMTAIHAFRGLKAAKWDSANNLRSLIGTQRLHRWIDRSWVRDANV